MFERIRWANWRRWIWCHCHVDVLSWELSHPKPARFFPDEPGIFAFPIWKAASTGRRMGHKTRTGDFARWCFAFRRGNWRRACDRSSRAGSGALARSWNNPATGAASTESRLRRHWFSHPVDARIDFGPGDFYSIGLLARSVTNCSRVRAHRPIWEVRWNPSLPAQVSSRMPDRWIFGIAFGARIDCRGGTCLRLSAV